MNRNQNKSFLLRNERRWGLGGREGVTVVRGSEDIAELKEEMMEKEVFLKSEND